MYLTSSFKDKIFFILHLLFITFLYHETGCNESISKRKKLVLNGDFMIGALIPVHEQPLLSSKKICGIIRDQYGVQRVEALLYMLDKINNKNQTNLLPGVKLGLDIRDECWETSIALEETIDFIKHTISIDDFNYKNFNQLNKTKSDDQIKCSQIASKASQDRIIAVIGPGGSGVAINVQNLLQLFDIPQIGYSASSKDLSDKNLFKTFLRVVPSDKMQVQAMIDVVLKMKWTYIFAVYTAGSYGQNGMETFRIETKLLNVCILDPVEIREYASSTDYEAIIQNMEKNKRARVIVCFCYGETIRGLLRAINKLNLKGRFIILGSDGWSDRIDVAQDYYEEALGSMSIKAYSPLIKEFDSYFTQLNPSNNLRNVWFDEYWQERFKCYLTGSAAQKKFTDPCEAYCPADFVSIENQCFYFSNEAKKWHEAAQECLTKNAEILSAIDTFEIKLLRNHFSKNDMPIFQSFFVRTESNNFHISVNKSLSKQAEEIFSLNKNELRFCQSSDSKEKTRNRENIFSYLGNTKICTSLKFVSASIENPLPYCLDINECTDQLPFICKLKKDLKAPKKTYYKHSLADYQQDPKMSYIMNAFLAVVYGLHNAQKKYCQGLILCDDLKKINGTSLLKNILASKFIGMGKESIYFDKNGDPPGRYVILNIQKTYNNLTNVTSYNYKEVGTWNNVDKLHLGIEKLEFPNGQTTIKSICSEKCSHGYVKVTKQNELSCCWTCKKCENYSYVVDDFTCQECKLGYWPNSNLTDCEPLPLVHLGWNEPATLFILIFSFFGIIANTFVIYVFVKFSNTSVVKATTRELSFIILIGAYFAYFMTIPLVLKPSIITCCLSRILPGFCLSLMYGALMTKTHRISRIFSRTKKKILTKKIRFLSITAQIAITCTLILIECLLIVIIFILEPDLTVVTYPVRNKARLECYNSILTILGPLGFNIILVICCTLFAFKTRNFPANFNEAKFIGFSMYTTCVIWLAFIPLYFGSDFKVITLCMSTSFSAIVLLAFLFAPKVYIILFEPEKNQRSMFITSKELRCHFGASSHQIKFKSSISYGNESIVADNLKKVMKVVNNQSCQTSLHDIQINKGGNEKSQSEPNQKNSKFLSNSELSLNKESILESSDSLEDDELKAKTEVRSSDLKKKTNDSLENFKSLFQNDKLTLNWNLIQSSDYL